MKHASKAQDSIAHYRSKDDYVAYPAAASGPSSSSSAASATYEVYSTAGIFWHFMEEEKYQALGYDEIHILWIQDKLGCAFKDEVTQDSIEKALGAIGGYLVQEKVQNIHETMERVKCIEKILDYWVHAIRYEERMYMI